MKQGIVPYEQLHRVPVEEIIRSNTEIHGAVEDYFSAQFRNKPDGARGSPPEIQAQTHDITFVDVTLRDGLQQDDIKKGEKSYNDNGEHIGYKGLTNAERLEIFDGLVALGIEEIEVGHFGNKDDQPFGRALMDHIASKSGEDERYRDVRLQVLSGATKKQMGEVVETLGDFDKERVTIHVYHRVGGPLRALTAVDEGQPDFTPEQSAQLICDSADVALGAGFRHISVSGEGAVDHLQHPDVAIDFHNTITRHLIDDTREDRAKSVNINLANTFGGSPAGLWDEYGLRRFNDGVKAPLQEFPDSKITTSMHTHDDVHSATEYNIAAIRAGFDKIEGSITGYGERVGNGAIVDTATRLVEQAMVDYETVEMAFRSGINVEEDELVLGGLSRSILAKRKLSQKFVDGLSEHYEFGKRLDEISEVSTRFTETVIGGDRIAVAGSGPHAQGTVKYFMNPLRNPLVEGYARNSVALDMQGAPDASKLINLDPEYLSGTISLNHASGGSSVVGSSESGGLDSEKVPQADPVEREGHLEKIRDKQQVMRAILTHSMDA